MAWWIKEMGHGWDLGDGLDLIEFYSGVGRIAKSAFHMGPQSRSFDIDHDKPPLGESVHSNMPKRSSFDLNGEAGFLLLGFNNLRAFVRTTGFLNCGDANPMLLHSTTTTC